MNHKSRLLFSTGLIIVLIAGCAKPQSTHPMTTPAINPDYKAGLIEIPTSAVPTLDQVINSVPTGRKEAKAGEDRLRGGAMRDAANSYGARAGLAWESRAINAMLQTKSAELSRIYDFNKVMIKGPDNVKIMPPVIAQAKESWETSEAGKTLRVADTVYEIIDQARFVSVPPLWQAYLVRDYKTPDAPPDVLLPKDSSEKEQWKQWVTEGWRMGQEQAQDIFKADLERLDRDFHGTLRYKRLLEEGKVSAPVVADARFGTTGSGQDMRVNDRAIRITSDPRLRVNNGAGWTSSPTPSNGPPSTVSPSPADQIEQRINPSSVKPQKRLPAARASGDSPLSVKTETRSVF